MESASFRSPSVLGDLNTNIQDDVVRNASPLSVSKLLKNSCNPSGNEIEYDINDQENKPPGSVESTSSTDGFKFKKPLVPNEDNTLNSLIDGLSHLKLGFVSTSEKRFNSCKWTTPLKKKVAPLNERRASSDCSLFEHNISHPILNDTETVENISVIVPCNKSDKESTISHNDDDCSEYYDCSDEENAIVEQADVSEISSDHCNTANSSFHSVTEKEHLASLNAANSTFVMNDSNSMNQANIAEMNQAQDSDQAYILEKYLTEQDFKLEISLSDVSFNAVTGGLDFELGKRQSVCSQTETPVAGSLFSFEQQEKTEVFSTIHQDVNDVTIQPDQFKYMGLFAKENEPQTEDALFNMLSDCLVQNETGSMFDAEPDENIFALGRLSQAGFLQFSDTEKNALMEQSSRRSLQLQSSDTTLNQVDVDVSQENNVPMQVNVEIEQLDETVSANEIAANSSLSSYPYQTNTDRFSSSFKVIDHSDDVETSNENASICAVKTTGATEVEQAATFEESLVENNQHSSFNELNETINPKAITTIDEIFTEMNKSSKNLNETIETRSPSSVNATIDTESINDDSFSEKWNAVADLETLNIAERDLEQRNDLPRPIQTVDLEASENFSLEIEGRRSFYRNLNETVDLEKTSTPDDYLDEQNLDSLKSNPNVDSETSRASFYEIEAEDSTYVSDYDENFRLGQDLSKLNRTSSFSIITTVSEEIEEMSLNRGISNESVDLNTVPVTNENFADECLESLKNLSVDSKSTEPVDEVIGEKSPDRKQLGEVGNSNSFPVLYKQCQEVLMNRTVSFEITELTPETVVKESPNKEKLNEFSNSEINPVSDTNLPEQSEESVVNSVDNSKITEADVDEKRLDQKQPNELDDLETIWAAFESHSEQNQELTIVIDESTSGSDDIELARSANSLIQLIRNVSFNLDITQIINDRIQKNQDDEKNGKSAHMSAIPVINQNIVDRSRESMELSEIDNLEDTCMNEEVTKDMKSGDPNKTYELEIDEKLQKDSFLPVPMSPELNETINLEVTRVIDKNVVDDSDNLNKISELKPRIIKTTFVSTPEQSHLNETIDLEVTRTYVDPDEIIDLDQQNKTTDLEPPTAIEVDSSVHIQESSHLNETIDLKVTRTYVDPDEIIDLDQQNKTTDLEPPTAIEVDSSVHIQESSHLNETIDLEVTRTYVDPDEIIDLDQQNKTTDLETPTAIEVDSSVHIHESSHLNNPVDMNVTQTYEENAANITDLDQRNRTTDLETSAAIEVDPRMQVQESSHLDDTVNLEVTRIIEENPENFVDFDKPNQTVDITTSTTIENHSSMPIQEQTELNETVDFKMIRPTNENTIAYSSEAVILDYDADALTKTEGSVSVVPIFSTESILKNSSRRINITNDELTSVTISPSNQDDISNVEKEIEVDEEPELSSTFREDPMEERELSDSSNSKSCDNTVIIYESPDRRCNSPARFDRYTASMPEPASPIPPNSPNELGSKWPTQFDLSKVGDYLESYTGRDSPSNSGDEMDVTDPIDSNIAPEMLQMAKQPPGSNWTVSNLESIPEMNETDSNEEQNTSEVQFEHDTKDPIPLEEKITADTESKPESTLNRTLTSAFSVDQGTREELSSTMSQTSPQAEPESGFNESVIVAAPNNPNDSIFKTPITKLPLRSDLSALNDSNFNADYCFAARTASAKSTQSSRNSWVSPKFSRRTSTLFSPFCTPNRRRGQGTPKNSGDVPPSLLDMSIGCFENYTANQAGPSVVPENELNKTVDVDEEPRIEETKLLCLDDPFKKVNVKTQTHDTELFDLRAENAKLKEDLNGLVQVSEAMTDKEAQFKETLQVLVHNEAELKKTVLQLEDNNRLLNNKFELLTEYSNELLARRNAELDEAEEKIRILETKLQEYTKKTKASSK